MRNQLVTTFWKNALQSLPREVRGRYVHHLEAAERWELRLAAAVELGSRAKAAVARIFQTPRTAHHAR
jgi:hypothetical protein